MTVAVVMAAVLTSGPTGCLLIVSTPPLQPKNVQSREKAPANHGARGETATMSFVPGANREGKERVKGKASRIQSSRIGSVLVCVRRNAQFRECVCVYVFFFIKFVGRTSRGHTGGRSGYTGFFVHLLSAVRALIFLARRIQSFLSLVDCEVEFCVLTI